jgi:hypothetical protein
MRTIRIALMLLLQPVLLRRTLGAPWVQWLMLALSAGAVALAIVFQSAQATAVACIAGAAHLLLWWALFVTSIGLPFSQRGVRLAPSLHRVALATTVVLYLCLVLIIALTVGSVFGHHALWALLAAWALTAVTLIVAGREAVGFIALAPLPLVLSRLHDAVPVLVPLATPVGFAAGAALLAASTCYALHLLMGRHEGGTDHNKFLDLWHHMASGTHQKTAPLLKPFAAAYASCLRGDCARRDKQNLLLHAAGPSLHWTGALSFQLTMLLGSLAYLLIPAVNAGQVLGMGAGLMLGSILVLLNGVTRLAAGQPEQALVRLAPGMPVASALNRLLARGLLGLFFMNWVVAMIVAVLLLGLAGATQAQFIEQMAATSVLVLPAAGMLRNFAVGNKGWDRTVRGLVYGLTFVLMVALMTATPLASVASYLFNWPALKTPGMAQAGLLLATLLFLLLAGLIVRWRWRAMLAAPPAFPAGRI